MKAYKNKEKTLQQIAAIAHHGGLIGYKDICLAMDEIRKLTLPWWNKEECIRLLLAHKNK